MQFDTVIFDMDGTVLDTLEDLADSVNAVMDRHGFHRWSLDDIRRFVGNGARQLLTLSVPGGQQNPLFDRCLQEFKEHYRENMHNKTAPYKGIPELLAKLRKESYKLAIVSNKPDAAVKMLAEHYFGDRICVAIGDSDSMKRKPAPDSVFAALKELGADRENAVFVGDSDIDIQTAKNAGILSVGVTWGFRDRKLLRTEGAEFIIDRPEQLLDVLNGRIERT